MSEAMNIIIAGSRDFDDYRLLKKTVIATIGKYFKTTVDMSRHKGQ